ncbi:hypothetical protein GDO81_009157 [Engystomops pustulosus]|uniref:Uncharacterized protein n=1 Tax=Engystomops pustulosus TaxID=76066 RepID=A0AAV7BNX8_ENGPU|nr:hypothetical protein GDO81_009157 [Engystomops pustulosus]
MKNKKTKNVDDQTRRKEHAQKKNVYGNVVEIKRKPVLNAAAEMNGASVTMDNYIGNDVYVNMDELNKEEQMIRTMKKGREPTVTKKESTSKIPKVQIIVAALILLVVLFLILIAITSVLFIYYLEMRKEVSHQKNLGNYALLSAGPAPALGISGKVPGPRVAGGAHIRLYIRKP